MKITKSDLQEIIKEEAVRLFQIQKLEEAQKNEILEKIENDLQIKIQNLHDKINKGNEEDDY